MTGTERLVEELHSPEETARIYAAEDLGDLDGDEAAEALLDRLPVENSSAVRDSIFQALARNAGAAAIAGAVRLLDCEHPALRNEAVDLLRRKGERALPHLAAAMRSPSKDVRKLVLDILRGVNLPGADPIYQAALRDPDINVVIAAVENLGALRATAYRAAIEKLLDGASHPMLQAVCLEALASCGDARSLEVVGRRFLNSADVPDFLLAGVVRLMGAHGGAAEWQALPRLGAARGAHLRPVFLDALLALRGRLPERTPGPEARHWLERIAREERADSLVRDQAARLLAAFPCAGTE